MSAPRVLLADADVPTRVGLRAALRRGGFEVVAEAEDAEAAVAAIERVALELALVDAALPGGSIDALARISRLRPAVRLIMLTASPNGDELLAAVLAGATGYLGKHASAARLPDALRGVLAGEVALPRRQSQRLLDELRRRAARAAAVSARAAMPLTDREWDVLELLAEGRSTAEMARRLRISEVTVRRHVSAVVAKLGVRDRAGAAAVMVERSLA
jgi:DNA-binding NarL/FixJ family response regulator